MKVKQFLMLAALAGLLFFPQLTVYAANGFVTVTPAGGTPIQVEIPYIPPFPYFATGGTYSIPDVAVPSYTTTIGFCILTYCFNFVIPDPLKLPSYILAVMENWFINGINYLFKVVDSGSTWIGNLFVTTFNYPIRTFDWTSYYIASFLLGWLGAVGEPWSLITVPIVWVAVIGFFTGTVIAALLLLSELINVAKLAIVLA